MLKNNTWEYLFENAMSCLKKSGLPQNFWCFGGGTVLMQKYNHRMSKDIDIFFRDPQLLSYISPRTNDAIEDILVDYSEQFNHTRLYFKEGEIDFIYAKQISDILPKKEKINGYEVYVDHPVEIIAKKIEYRGEEFKSRDVFDLALVYSKLKLTLLKNLHLDIQKIDAVRNRITILEKEGILEKELKSINLLPGAKNILGKEYSLCQMFLSDMEKCIKKNITKSLKIKL